MDEKVNEIVQLIRNDEEKSIALARLMLHLAELRLESMGQSIELYEPIKCPLLDNISVYTGNNEETKRFQELMRKIANNEPLF